MPLGGTKAEHFSCFHSSCQLGLRFASPKYSAQKIAQNPGPGRPACVLDQFAIAES